MDLKFKKIKGPDNDTSEALSRLTLFKYDVKNSNIVGETLADSYYVEKLDRCTSPLTYQTVNIYKHKD